MKWINSKKNEKTKDIDEKEKVSIKKADKKDGKEEKYLNYGILYVEQKIEEFMDEEVEVRKYLE